MKQNCFSMPNPNEIQSLIEFCKVMASAPFYQKLGPGGVMAIYLTAREYDLPFMACMNQGLYTFDGKVTFSAIMINALILRSGHKADLLHLDDQKCTIRFTRHDRKGDPSYTPLVYTYTREMAEKAGYLRKDNWKNSFQDMVYCRTLTGGGRKHIPEVFVGVMVAGELVGDISDQYIEPVLPPNLQIESTEQQPESTDLVDNTPQIAITDQKSESYDDFLLRHELIAGTQGYDAIKAEFLAETVKAYNRSEVYVINAAIKNEASFLDRFDKWKAKKNPTANLGE
jgi:hypothetical protein